MQVLSCSNPVVAKTGIVWIFCNWEDHCSSDNAVAVAIVFLRIENQWNIGGMLQTWMLICNFFAGQNETVDWMWPNTRWKNNHVVVYLLLVEKVSNVILYKWGLGQR